jgi:hypothetical protein
MHDRLQTRRRKRASELPANAATDARKAPIKSKRQPRESRISDDAIVMEVGSRVKRLRTQAGLTL